MIEIVPAMSSARRAKSADRIEGTISIIYGLCRFYHTGVETVPGVAPRNPPHAPGDEGLRHGRGDAFVLLGFERAGGVYQDAAGGQRGARVGRSEEHTSELQSRQYL